VEQQHAPAADREHVVGLNLQQLLHDRRAQVVAGIAAVGGLVVLLRRKSSTSSTGTTTAAGGLTSGTDAASGTGGSGGTYDSTSSDIAAALGNLQAQQQTSLAGFQQSLTDGLTQLSAGLHDTGPGSSSAIPTGSTTPGSSTPPATAAPATGSINRPTIGTVGKLPASSASPTVKPAASKIVTVARGATLTSIAKANGTSVTAIMKLNPKIVDKNKITAGQKIKVK
jgi:LysM repeat protein